MYRYFLIPLFLMPELVHARSVIAIAEKFLTEAIRLGAIVSTIGFVFGAASMAAGKHGGGSLVTNSLVGLTLCLAATAVGVLVRSIV